MKNTIAVIALLVVAAAAGFFAQQYFQKAESVSTKTTPHGASEMTPDSASVAETKIAFEMPDLEGNMRALSEWEGDARLVNFWATWCEPCRREIPLLKQVQAQKAEKGLQIIGIAVEYPEDVLPYAEQAEFNYPILVGQQEAMEAAEQSGVEFIGLPFTMVISAAGDLVNVHSGEIKVEHIDRIVEVMQELGSGAVTLQQAREALYTL
jgi:thiol-disulfide isomerase/thioredoxin